MQFKRSTRAAYRRAASEALTEEVPSLRMRLAARPPHLVVRERACWAGMSVEGEWRRVGMSEQESVQGTCKWFNSAKGWGWLVADGTEPGEADIFCHHTMISMPGYRTLREGQRVRFRVETGPKGAMAAEVVPL